MSDSGLKMEVGEYRKQSSDGYPDSAKVEALPTQKLAGL